MNYFSQNCDFRNENTGRREFVTTKKFKNEKVKKSAETPQRTFSPFHFFILKL